MTATALGSPVVSITALGVPVVKVTDGAGNTLWTTGGGGNVSPSQVNGTARSNSSIPVVTAVATAKNGISYSWTQTSGDGDWQILYPTSAQTAFRHGNTPPDSTYYNATFQVTITYAGGGTATASVSARVINISTM